MKKKILSRAGVITISTILVLFFASPFVSYLFINAQSIGKIYKVDEISKNYESAIVLGAAAYDYSLSTVLEDRMNTAIKLYKNKKIKKIIVSGSGYEVNAMKKYAIKNGVLENDIIGDNSGFNTFSSMKNIENAKNIIIISQKYHLPRALFIASHFNIDAIGVEADVHKYRKINDFKKREFFANSKAILDLFVFAYKK